MTGPDVHECAIAREVTVTDFRESQFRDDDAMLRRRGTDPLIEVLSHNVARMREDMSELKSSITKLTDAIAKLVVLEERQNHMIAAQERAFVAIANVETRVEKERADSIKTMEGMYGKFESLMHRLHERMDKADERLDELEKAAPTQALTSSWILEGVKALAIVAVMFALNKVGLM
jgi:DNA repair exonuclease SbcCD ATPase subunit